MESRAPFLVLIALLVAAGFSAASYRHNTYDIPWLPRTDAQVWQIEARVELQTQGDSSHVYLTLPPEQSNWELVNEAAAASGWGFELETSDGQRRAHWTRRASSGGQMLFYKLDFTPAETAFAEPPPSGPEPTFAWNEPYNTAAQDLIETATPLSADPQSLAVQLLQLVNSRGQNANLLLDQYSPAQTVVQLLRTSGHHARVAQVIPLEDGRRRMSLIDFIQVWDGTTWRIIDPRQGVQRQDQPILIWQAGAPGVLDVVGGTNSRVSFSVLSQTRSGLLVAQEKVGDLVLSLYNLPIAEQGMFKLIMLLPIGALVVVLLRVLIGIRTSGTFMPVLIALAFLQTELLPGLVSFVLVVIMGLFIRSYLSSLNLLLVARIATLVIIVIGIISIFSIISYRLGLIEGLTITFFPMIILAWTIERMSIIWEEEGPKEVFVQGSGSLLVAIAAYLLMNVKVIEHLVFNFPELHLISLALVMLVGRYTGYRLLELKRFAAFKD
ncbi:MAG: gonadoliberin III [Pseudomonadales bacterium]|nr:gonadoliberin III [Pseudomonadales bacterium]